MSDDMSVIVIQIDSLNRHFLPIHGNDWINAPNLTAFAERSATFQNHFTGSLPCMPARREAWAGTEEFWWREWGPLEPWDKPVAHLAGHKGITSQLITDHYHFFEWGSHNYHYDFEGYDFIRGHEHDNWRTDRVDDVPDWATEMIRRRNEGAYIYLNNTQDFRGEQDFFGPRVMNRTAEWLRKNRDLERFYLHVDCFDVHEPFHVPEPYRSMYSDDDYRKYNPWPLYGNVDQGPGALSPEEVAWVRAQFAGKLTMVDTWFGRVLDALDETGILDRSCVIVTTDHGHFLGDHGWMGKPAAPLYNTLCHIPLFVWHPQGSHNGQRVDAMTQTVDLYSTILELLGCDPPDSENVHSRSFAPAILGKADSHRDHAVYAYNNERIGITAGEWTLLRDQDQSAAPAYWYTHQVEQLGGRGRGWARRRERPFEFPELRAGPYIPGVSTPVWRMDRRRPIAASPPRSDLLFNNSNDPNQTTNLAESRPEVVRELEAMLRGHALEIGAPEEQLTRLRL
ncbi:MAG: sulfatase [Trueperaceae bacterium]